MPDGVSGADREAGVARTGLGLHFEQVARSHRIPESDFRTPLDDAVEAVLREHGS